MKRLYIAAAAGIALLLSLAYWKNSFSYKSKPRNWRIGKSIIDCVLVVLSALYLPALLVGWCVMWLTRPIRRRGIQITLAVIVGIALASIGGVALEILCILGIFAVDLLTGKQGLHGWYHQHIPDTFLPSLKNHKSEYDVYLSTDDDSLY